MTTRMLIVALLAACSPVTLLEPDLSCAQDTDCGANMLCEGQLCTACPDVSQCEPPDEPGPWIARTRNGCVLCEFAPPTECTGASDCSETCYLGAWCAPGCNRLDCCSNACSEEGCSAPVPLGCRVRCPRGMNCPRDKCIAETCHCDGRRGRWYCEARCADVAPWCSF